MSDNQLEAYYGKDLPSASFKWGVVVPVHGPSGPGLPAAIVWRAVAWFKTQKRAIEYAHTGFAPNYAIARMK